MTLFRICEIFCGFRGRGGGGWGRSGSEARVLISLCFIKLCKNPVFKVVFPENFPYMFIFVIMIISNDLFLFSENIEKLTKELKEAESNK